MSVIVLAGLSAVAVGGRAMLIEGGPGSGKSSLALALIDRGATLIGDDGVTLVARDGVVMAEPPPNIAGLIEVRNVGLITLATTSAPVALVLALSADAPRYPLDTHAREIGGITVPVLHFRPGDAVQALRAEYALEKHGLPIPPTAALADNGAA